MQDIKKVVAIGPESTGKSTLCQQLAAHYNTLWCPEYAREYLLKHGTDYSFDDLLTIAEGQLALEEVYTKKLQLLPGNEQQILFVDTDMYVMKVWCEVVFGKCHQFILDKIEEQKTSLYLLCNVDLPWTKDELREYPDFETREKLYHIYKDILTNQSLPWAIVSGVNEMRFKVAVEAVDKLLKT